MKNICRNFFVLACFFSFLSVALGAFAAHGLKSYLSSYLLDIFEVGVRYQMYHSLALFVVGFHVKQFSSKSAIRAGFSFCLGILLFSGSLYALSLTGIKKFGMITPLGGIAFLAGWALLAISFLSHKDYS